MASTFPYRSSSLLALIGAVAAQNITVPAPLDGVEGGSGSNIPFGSNLACRYQCLYDASVLPWSGPLLISGISIRADNGTPLVPGNAIAAKGFLDVSIAMSTTYASAATASATFDDNYGEDVQWVLTHYHIQLPAQPALTTTGPRPANVDFMFATPWFYGLTPARGNQPAPRNLLVEIWIHAQPTGAYRIDNLGGCIAAQTQFGNQGPACYASNAPNQPTPPLGPTLTPDPSMIAGGPFSWTVANAAPSAPFLLAFNLTAQGGLFGLPQYPLPYPMFDPQNPSQPSPALAAAMWPAPDCWLNIDPAVTLFGVCGTNGIGVITTQLPSGGRYVGTELFAQGLIYSQTANSLNVITTLGRSSTICGPLDTARIHAFYNNTANPPPPPPATGAAQYGQAMVFEVR
ncbi:MAG: hypothetical protein U1E73_03840 [Planctomycetota bacterium]